jgi:IS5 family transposase
LSSIERLNFAINLSTKYGQYVKNTGFAKGNNSAKIKIEGLNSLKNIVELLIHDLRSKMETSQLNDPFFQIDMDLFNKILAQGKYSKNKIYSLHEPQVRCIAKGKSEVKYEYGNKLTILMTPIDCIILGIANIKDNKHDNATIPEIEELLSSRYDGYKPSKLIVDMGYRGYQKYTDLDVIIPQKDDKKFASADLKTKVEALNRRSAIE